MAAATLSVGVLLAILEAAPEIRVPFRVDSHHSSKLGGKSQGGRRDRNQPYRESPQRECITLDRTQCSSGLTLFQSRLDAPVADQVTLAFKPISKGQRQDMTEPRCQNVTRILGFDGSPLTMADLPAPGTTRWVIRRKAAVVAAVRGGLYRSKKPAAAIF